MLGFFSFFAAPWAVRSFRFLESTRFFDSTIEPATFSFVNKTACLLPYPNLAPIFRTISITSCIVNPNRMPSPKNTSRPVMMYVPHWETKKYVPVYRSAPVMPPPISEAVLLCLTSIKKRLMVVETIDSPFITTASKDCECRYNTPAVYNNRPLKSQLSLIFGSFPFNIKKRPYRPNKPRLTGYVFPTKNLKKFAIMIPANPNWPIPKAELKRKRTPTSS